MLEENISERSAFMRLICGVSMTACGVGRIAHRPNCWTGHIMIAAGAMKIAEGIFHYCPMKAMLGSGMQNSDYTTSHTFDSANFMSTEQVSQFMKEFSDIVSGNSTETTTQPKSNGSNSVQNPS
ncbi:DUF2892 domain-containing protein [Metasolibacillus meyeri]|uniref:DUF2892 domain-containing protein n=1 Tax=Metasolibacillus meyeri TaxID=1071052 RepID=A0AAW9NU51_9BACL|nr:DUF2892 domain-containing protein [Metasolibacillus meyeri]MEC1179773.1 DUF2892 domain-containing protein [Metasolibacillus meyeri]